MTEVQLLRGVATQTRVELMLASRRGESVLVTIVIPPLLLLFLGSTQIVSTADQGLAEFLVPGILALAIISTSMVSLGIASAFERYYGVLKRLGSTPLSRSGLLAAKMLSVLVIELAQVALIVGLAIGVFHWSPVGSAWTAALGLLLGTVAFAAIGLLLAGTLRAEATLAAANGLYVLCLLFGGIVIPPQALPGWLGMMAVLLPPGLLTESLRAALNGGEVLFPLALLGVWALIAAVAAARCFRWE